MLFESFEDLSFDRGTWGAACVRVVLAVQRARQTSIHVTWICCPMRAGGKKQRRFFDTLTISCRMSPGSVLNHQGCCHKFSVRDWILQDISEIKLGCWGSDTRTVLSRVTLFFFFLAMPTSAVTVANQHARLLLPQQTKTTSVEYKKTCCCCTDS